MTTPSPKQKKIKVTNAAREKLLDFAWKVVDPEMERLRLEVAHENLKKSLSQRVVELYPETDMLVLRRYHLTTETDKLRVQGADLGKVNWTVPFSTSKEPRSKTTAGLYWWTQFSQNQNLDWLDAVDGWTVSLPLTHVMEVPDKLSKLFTPGPVFQDYVRLLQRVTQFYVAKTTQVKPYATLIETAQVWNEILDVWPEARPVYEEAVAERERAQLTHVPVDAIEQIKADLQKRAERALRGPPVLAEYNVVIVDLGEVQPVWVVKALRELRVTQDSTKAGLVECKRLLQTPFPVRVNIQGLTREDAETWKAKLAICAKVEIREIE